MYKGYSVLIAAVCVASLGSAQGKGNTVATISADHATASAISRPTKTDPSAFQLKIKNKSASSIEFECRFVVCISHGSEEKKEVEETVRGNVFPKAIDFYSPKSRGKFIRFLALRTAEITGSGKSALP